MAFTKLIIVAACCLSCVFCMAVPTDTCVDQVNCDTYPPTICTDPQYLSWKMINCPNYCGVCKKTTVSHVGVGRFMDNDNGPVCKDTYPDCAAYGTKICTDVKFFNWVNDNCQAHCNRCTVSCEDKLPNCSEYGGSVCTELSYYNWVEMNCRKFCGRC